MDIKEMQEPTSLKELFQKITPEEMSIVRGKVISVSPLKIQVINDEKLILEQNNICLPRQLTSYQTTVDIVLGKGSIESTTEANKGKHAGHVTGDGAHTHPVTTFDVFGATMTVYSGLRSGDVVYILSFNRGKKYYVLDREA